MSNDARHGGLGTDTRTERPELVESLFAGPAAAPAPGARATGRSGRSHAARRRSRRTLRARIIPLIAVIVIVAVAAAGYVIARRAVRSFDAANYTGSGTGEVIVKIKADDGARDIASTLRAKDVVASTKAFLDAADASGRSRQFQPGWFKMRRHMSGKAAVTTLLNPAARLSTKLTVPEGLIEPAVLTLAAKATRLPKAALITASKDIKNLGLPTGFVTSSAEGFLFPSTYEYDPDVTATQALQDMTTQFQAVIRKLDFVAGAARLKLTPYQVLTIASMIEAEARFPQDRSKVARVVINRLARHINLGFDSTTAYALKIEGKDPRSATYRENSPYNTRLRPGLPPTPIGNPGEAALSAAVHPGAGNWLYFVSKDAAGHLFFTNDPKAFDAASQLCRVNKWGCT